ncbi:hypothetical protein OVA24_11875 [Luteolibacter sp. SL250]|uniref:hypothetical protein n=1 Tax=Luteolibacter sp. SL250 TaxID=2995170 RepID=UPI00226FBD14|nr:hypothetical protein [Luteolibacter sp. SL250]WAC17938.1 hypothetical protein OVA24_11875 [Luteolibacter sp. SL250]
MKHLLGAAGAVAAIVTPLRAELPPQVYDDLRNKAAEVLRIRVDQVDSKPKGFLDRSSYTETVRATVTGVTRTGSGVKEGDSITITYHRPVPAKGWVGPSPPPQLKQGWKYTAYLGRNEGGTFGISARGMSFSKLGD